MNPLFASAALGLAAAWPASGLGWLLGKTADRLTGDPAPRVRAWNRAVSLPPAALALMVGVAALPEQATAPVYRAVMTSKAAASAGAAMSEASTRALAGFDGIEVVGGLLILAALGGFAIAAVQELRGHARVKRLTREARPVSQDLTLAVRAAARRMDTGRPEVKISDAIDQPMLAGLSTPVILLPSALVERLDIERLAPVCAHELAHLKRGDNWRLLVEHLLGGLFWMVPPFAAVRARAASAREELCDAMALENATPAARRGYAETLIDVLRVRAAPSLQPAFTGKGRRPTAMRVKAITDPRDPASLARRALLGLAGLLAVALAVSGSIALAQQSETHSRTRTIIGDDKTGQYVDIRSDYVRVTNAELINGRLKIPDGQVSTYHGHVQIRGRLRAPETMVLLNGQAPPAGFDPTALPQGAIDAVEVVSRLENDRSRVTLNILTKTL
ncbi:M56 family metallopeptidase [Caulobacter sp.]|uniref:M56 family metallopeptidase n=1 Tax=Caulobacter sp. TaxID=78 RepID=UPI002B49D6B9|nr:M56 family metallopeptidase [Caulobacter sp.]HJV43130.1 M56 family metallopeptidase [Caulobacter sp.]